MLPLHQTPMEHWAGVEPANSGFADRSSTDGVPAHFGAPGEARTRDPLIKSQVLLPTELLAHIIYKVEIFQKFAKRFHLQEV